MFFGLSKKGGDTCNLDGRICILEDSAGDSEGLFTAWNKYLKNGVETRKFKWFIVSRSWPHTGRNDACSAHLLASSSTSNQHRFRTRLSWRSNCVQVCLHVRQSPCAPSFRLLADRQSEAWWRAWTSSCSTRHDSGAGNWNHDYMVGNNNYKFILIRKE